jgi:hypothetical protein
MADYFFNDDFCGGNSDQYSDKGKIWEDAKAFNEQSKEENGHTTVVRRKQVESYRRVGLL